jgi:hypothetical protein
VNVRVQSLSSASGPSLWAVQTVTTSGTASPVGGEHIADDALDGKVITGALLRTAATGKRWEIQSGTYANEIRAYSGDPDEMAFGGLSVDTDTYSCRVRLLAPDVGMGQAALELLSPHPDAANPQTSVRLWADSGEMGPLSWDFFNLNLRDPLHDSLVRIEDTGWVTSGVFAASVGWSATYAMRRVNRVVTATFVITRTGADIPASTSGNITNVGIGAVDTEWTCAGGPVAFSVAHIGGFVGIYLLPGGTLGLGSLAPGEPWPTGAQYSVSATYIAG